MVGFFGEPGVKVVDVCCVDGSLEQGQKQPLVFSYNTTAHCYQIWAVRLATSAVRDGCVCVCTLQASMNAHMYG